MPEQPSRRTVLTGAGLAAAAVAVPGCSKYGESSNAPATQPASGSALAQTADIPVGGGKVFSDARVVVTQPEQGSFKCFTAVCTHQGCVVEDVADGTINCGCHGSRFSDKDGSVVNGPASQPLAAEKITVSGGAIKLG